jgi:hypothetical protein
MARVTSRDDQLSGRQTSTYVHVKVANFSHEQIKLPKATILGIAEETPNSLVAAINDRKNTNFSRGYRKRSRNNAVAIDPLFEQYLKDKLGHLFQEERAVMEPVLTKYRYVFHKEGGHDFPKTDLVEHKLLTGELSLLGNPLIECRLH